MINYLRNFLAWAIYSAIVLGLITSIFLVFGFGIFKAVSLVTGFIWIMGLLTFIGYGGDIDSMGYHDILDENNDVDLFKNSSSENWEKDIANYYYNSRGIDPDASYVINLSRDISVFFKPNDIISSKELDGIQAFCILVKSNKDIYNPYIAKFEFGEDSTWNAKSYDDLEEFKYDFYEMFGEEDLFKLFNKKIRFGNTIYRFANKEQVLDTNIHPIPGQNT